MKEKKKEEEEKRNESVQEPCMIKIIILILFYFNAKQPDVLMFKMSHKKDFPSLGTSQRPMHSHQLSFALRTARK